MLCTLYFGMHRRCMLPTYFPCCHSCRLSCCWDRFQFNPSWKIGPAFKPRQLKVLGNDVTYCVHRTSVPPCLDRR